MDLKLVDTHCHPQFPQYDADRGEVIQRALDAGIGMVVVGTNLETSKQAVELSSTYEGLWCSVGLHPNDPEEGGFEGLLEHPKVVAVGEVGLDYYRSPDRRQEQIERLKKFIGFAVSRDKPLIIHCRDAHEDMLQILPAHRGVIHSFTGSVAQALQYIERGYHIGFNGIITFAREYDDAVRAVSLERILLETDSPYLAPVSKRGKRNEPVYITEIAQMIGELKNVESDEVARKTIENSKHLFGI